MNRLPRRLARPNSSTPPAQRRSRHGAGLILLCGLMYGLAGFLVVALPPVPWLWPLALLGLGLHIWDLSLTAGAMAPRRGAGRLGPAIIHLLAALGLTLPLAIALNYLGSDQLNEITVGGAAGQVILLSLGAVIVALLCRRFTAQLGRQLAQRLSLRQMRGVLALVGLIGLTLGGALGFLAV